MAHGFDSWLSLCCFVAEFIEPRPLAVENPFISSYVCLHVCVHSASPNPRKKYSKKYKTKLEKLFANDKRENKYLKPNEIGDNFFFRNAILSTCREWRTGGARERLEWKGKSEKVEEGAEKVSHRKPSRLYWQIFVSSP